MLRKMSKFLTALLRTHVPPLSCIPRHRTPEVRTQYFALCATSTLLLAPAGFKFGDVIDRLSQAVVNKVIILYQDRGRVKGSTPVVVGRTPVRWRFPFGCASKISIFRTLIATPDASSFRLVHLERIAEDALSSSQKVGRASKNIVPSYNHKGVLTDCGYETPQLSETPLRAYARGLGVTKKK